MTETSQTHSFQAEVNQVLSIVVGSLYSNREVFLRELISNASDALDKLSFRALTQHDLLEQDGELRVELVPDPEAGTLTVSDNGIGMTREETIENLGTIARSGSKRLVEALRAEGKQDLSLIGQFGVGFYSAFLVADRVTVDTKPADGSPATRWESEAKGEFTITDGDRTERGTSVVLHLKPDDRDLLQEWTLKGLVQKYSDYVRYPIRLRVERTRPVGDEKDEKGQPKQTETAREWETVNSASALWTRPKSEVTEEQYTEFYKHLAHAWDEPLAHTHFKVEGTHELTGLLFVPAQRPFDLFDRKPHGLRLFVKRVFVMEDCEEILPPYLRFVRGVIDSEDLPLNVSRELLQQDRTTRFIRKQVVSKTLALLEDLAAEDGEREEGEAEEPTRYERFWRAFGAVLKEGVHLDPGNHERIAPLLRYDSSREQGLVSLGDYVGRMAPDQPAIYYVTAPNLETARKSPHIEALSERDYEVLYMVDPIDEWVVEGLREFEGKKLVAADKGSLSLPEDEESDKKRGETEGRFAALTEAVKGLFEDRLAQVRMSERLLDSPACLVTDEHGISPHVERILRASGQDVPPQKRILELNPEHPVVRTMQSMAEDPARRADLEEWSRLLYDQALVAEGSLPDDPAGMARSIAGLMKRLASGEG